MFLIEPQIVKTDVTSVRILRNHYLVGVGGYINIFDKESCQLKLKINIFEGQKIYGIIPDEGETRILVFSGRYIKIISIDENFTKINEYSKIAPDWVLAAKWIDNFQRIATVSMNNRLQIWSTNLELITEVKCEEKCILYSAFICYSKFKELVVLSGTVFSEVLIWKPDKERDSLVLKRLQKHKGVIFSVHYNEASGNICSSSDDRSAVLWKPKTGSLLTELQKENIEINIICHVFGHTSRIFRCHSLERCFLTAGEDSLLNIWSLDGKLIRKIETHQGGPIWTIDANETDNIVLTGGSDCGVTLFPINCNFDERELLIPNKEVPKIVRVLSNNNYLIVFCESGILYFHNRKTQEWLQIQEHYDLKSYALVEVSKCKNLVALAGFEGQVYIYKHENESIHQIISFRTKNKSRIFALHWIDCSSLLMCEGGGKITLYFLKNDSLIPISTFVLPPSKERWSTTAVFTGKHFVIGDRKGNVHLFEFGKCEPVQTLKRVHSHLGVTNLIVENDKIVSLGRNAVIKTFSLNNNALQLISSNKLPFTWLVGIVQDLLLAFSGDKFILWNVKTKRLIFEKSCGGGHRSWDFLTLNDDISFCYIKDKMIHTVDLSLKNLSPVDLIEGYQVREINSVQAIKLSNDYIIVSGGEDTTLRVNLTDGTQFSSIDSLKPHLSSIRTIAMHKISENGSGNKETYLVFSGGGRAQIICWKFEVYTENDCFRDLFCSEQHSYYKVIDNEESEMRIMDLTVAVVKNRLFLFAACSDGNIKTFSITDKCNKYELKFYRDIFYKLKCILKVCVLNVVFSRSILVTMATDGKLVFWDVSDIKTGNEIKSFYTIQSHQSGINSYSFKMHKNDSCLFLTGGDDNAIVLTLISFRLAPNVSAETVDTFTDVGTHCAQITGVFLNDVYFLTASIDQRITVFEWQLLDKKLVCKRVAMYNTAISDIQGLRCFENSDFDLFVYGKGIEYIRIKKKS